MSNIEERQRKCWHDQMFRGGERDHCGDCGEIRGGILAVGDSVCEHPTRDRILAEKGDGIAQWCLQCGAFQRGQYADWVMPSNTRREWSRLRAIERDRAEWKEEAIRRGISHDAQDKSDPAEDAEWFKARYEASQNVAEWHKSRHDIVQKVLRETRDLLDEERARVERLNTAIGLARDSLSTAKVWDDRTTVPRAAPLEPD